jgi:hypothetical protein
MLHTLAARVLMMATETGEDIAECPLLITECINYVLRKMPASLRTTLAFNIQIEVMSVMYDAVYMDFGNAPEFDVDPR